MKGSENTECRHELMPMYDRFLDTLFEKDRLSYIGKIVRGLIHNINGPLQNISMLVEMLMRGQNQLDQLVRNQSQSFLDQWETLHLKQQQRFQQLTRQITLLTEILRDFMVLQEIERNESELDLKLVLVKLAGVFHADLFLKHHVNLQLRVEDGLPLIRVLGRDLIPALVHLIQNALIAVRETPEKRVTIDCGKEGNWIRIIFRDTGCGFDMDRNNEAFFDLFYSNWGQSQSLDENGERHFGFGLFAARRLLEPYGVKVSLEREGGETLAIIQIPLPS